MVNVTRLKLILIIAVYTICSGCNSGAFIKHTYYHYTHKVVQQTTDSMSPEIKIQDYVAVDTHYFSKHPIQRFDVVMYGNPKSDGEETFHLHRVIGLSGEKIELHGGIVVINDVALKESYPTTKDEYNGDYGPLIIPEGKFFLLGDNRANSADSRVLGPIDAKQIKGKVKAVY
jgi:signal peptidase I